MKRWRVRRNGHATAEVVDRGVVEMVLLGGTNIRVVGMEAALLVDAVFADAPVANGTTITARVAGHAWSLTYDEGVQ